MLARIFNLVRKELIHFRRDRLLTPFVLFGPLFQLVMLAAATSSDITNLRVAVYDQDHSSVSRSLVTAFDNSTQMDVIQAPSSQAAGQALIEAGAADMLVVIPPNFAADLTAGAPQPAVQVIIDGSNVIVGLTLQRLAQGILTYAQGQWAAERWGLRPTAGIDVRPVVYYNQELNHRYSTLPAQLGLIVYMVTMMVASFGIARERERGTMEQLRVTPLRRSELLIGKAIPVIVIALTDFAVMLAANVFIYKVPLRGSVLLLFGLTALYILAEMGVGLTISSVAVSQQQSLLMVFLVGVLNIAFSGYLVPVKNMPWLLSQLSWFFPVRHYMTIVRNIMLKGAGLADLQADVLALVLLGSLIMAAAYRLVHSRLD
jgi:ABC-2 type transport system permease protein